MKKIALMFLVLSATNHLHAQACSATTLAQHKARLLASPESQLHMTGTLTRYDPTLNVSVPAPRGSLKKTILIDAVPIVEVFATKRGDVHRGGSFVVSPSPAIPRLNVDFISGPTLFGFLDASATPPAQTSGARRIGVSFDSGAVYVQDWNGGPITRFKILTCQWNRILGAVDVGTPTVTTLDYKIFLWIGRSSK